MASDDHLYELSAGWTIWRSICVRGAGFPADTVLALASPITSAAIDRLLVAEDERIATSQRAIAAVKSEAESHTEVSQRRAIAHHLRRLRSGDVVGASPSLSEPTAAVIATHRAASLAFHEHRAIAATVLDAELRRFANVLRETGREPRFREALVWQNRTALHNGVDVLLRQPDGATNSRARQHERLIATYLQRYCLKNDWIGFFGPTGWATIDAKGPPIAVHPGRSLLASRSVYFEYWAIDTLATALAQDPALRRALAPRSHPTVRLDGTTLHHPLDRTTVLPLEYAQLLRLCDGARSAQEIVAHVLQDSELELSGENEVYEMLEELASQRALIWTVEVPPHVEHPDRVLGEVLDAIADPEVAAVAAAKLAELQTARDEVGLAAGDASALDRAFTRLEETFTRHTGANATRRAGQTYAGRTLVYEDCRRDVEIAVGPALIDRLRAPLALLLASARWFTFTLARRYRETLTAVHRDLQRETGSPAIDFLRFWQRASDHFSGHDRRAPPLVDAVARDLQGRWMNLLGLEGGVLEQHRVDLEADQLAAPVATTFAAPGPGWPSARHHSPDLLIAATGVDAIARGDFTIVCGELHIAYASFTAPATLRQHPAAGGIVAALMRDRPVSALEAVVSKERAMRPDRFSIAPHDLDLELGNAKSWRPRSNVVEAGSLVVEPAGDSLCVRNRSGTHRFALEELLDSFLSNESTSQFKLLPAVQHCPRVSIDRLVVIRETWRFATSQLDFISVTDRLDRMVAVRRWARAHQLPRFLFYKIPEETKPCYVDLESPHFVDLFSHLARKASEVVVSEMLPTVDQVWLPDADGARYTCELRTVVVDPVPWHPESVETDHDPDSRT